MDRRNEVEALFEKALGLTPEARTALLDAIKAQDATLYAEVASLLEAHDDAETFFDRLSDKFVSPLFSSLDEEPPMPEHVGPYRIVRELGRGGMSTVYLARRDDGQFEQHVALKVVRSGLDDAVLRHRFRSERQILASLNHPHVAHLFDGGVLPRGRPYLVMEYVEGEPIDRYCDARTLSLEDRLRLFQTVIKTVQYAHQNLVVHRDLKPSNILVTHDGQVKLLDFGIAKLLDADASSNTQTGLRLMTPEYAAPEQIKGERITTATDVYQLGVMLYHLLTGHRPYRLKATSTYDIERAVCEDDPTRPSTIVGQVEEVTRGEATVRITPEAVAQTRATEQHVLQRTLSGDLDAMLLKALRKEPEQRYASAEAFADDIRRYLEGRPVKARRGTWSYRARKYVRRHAWGVAAAAVITALVTGYAATFWIQARQVAEERDRAQSEADKAEQVTEFLIDLFERADPDAVNIDSITARQLLDQGARQVRALGDQPQTQAQLLVAIGRVYEKLGLYPESVRLLDSSLALRRQIFQEPHPDLAEGRYHLAHTLFFAGDYDQAEALLREALALWAPFPEAKAQEARGLVLLASLLEARGDYAGADSLNRRALQLQHAVWGDAHPDIADALANLAGSRRDQGDHAGADSLYRQALAMQRTLLGETHLDVAATLNNLAALRMVQGRYTAADSLYEQSLSILQQNLGDRHPDLARVLNNLGILRQRTGRLASAETLLRQALAIREQFLDPGHAGMAIAYYNLASVLQDRGDYAAAESLYRRTLAIDRAVYGDESPDVAIDLTRFASLFHDKGDLREATRHYAQALSIGRKTLPADHPRLANILVGYGRVLVEGGRAVEAEDLLRRALAVRSAIHGADHPDTVDAQAALGACLTALRRFDEAASMLRASYEALTATLAPNDPRMQQLLDGLIALYDAWGKPAQAATYRARKTE